MMTWRDSLVLNEQLLTVIELCNLDKKAIKRIEAQRTKNRRNIGKNRLKPSV
ncbi:hypothetical protein LDL57_05660 [Arsenophonus apicola]|uniref:hypothetical protein n=1 Tax=Arsenophonus apicola TaxID=2879119 RepID=UPI001CDCA75C|nr:MULTISPECIES: hypothetical protein [Arsenophonus]UBX30096.1 hypothetical protein LDL57_05660 [Arsenophonus apicola]